jgi:hypothetical protein
VNGGNGSPAPSGKRENAVRTRYPLFTEAGRAPDRVGEVALLEKNLFHERFALR